MRPRTYKHYDMVFRQGVLAMLERSGRSLPVLAADLGIPSATLRYWYERDQMAKRKKLAKGAQKGSAAVMVSPDSPNEQDRIARLEREVTELRKENEELKMDRAILKKAAAFFAKESE